MEHHKVESHAGPDRRAAHALAISNAIVRLHKEYIGRGPARVRTHIEDDLVVSVLDGGFTRAEQTLEKRTGHATVVEMRLQLEEAMKRDIIDVLQATVGRTVRSVMSASDPEQNLEVVVMLLSPRPRSNDSPLKPSPPAREQASSEVPGSLREDPQS